MKLSPMMEHYIGLKEQYKDCIIFYRLGDFYEMFFDDAVKASSLLDLTLTGRDCGLKERAPMCGVPFHAADFYIDKLVSLGEKVAICEQLSSPTGKDLVKRDVIKVVTAGTITNSDYIDDRLNNFIVSVFIDKGCSAIAWADITTGEFFTKDFDKNIEELFNNLLKINPSEIICSNQAYDLLINSPYVERKVLPRPELFIESEYSLYSAEKVIKSQLNTANLSYVGLTCERCVSCSGALISYLRLTQKIALDNIKNISTESDDSSMMLDHNTIRNLELVKTNRESKRYGSLLWLLDKTKTSMGARKLHSWITSPLISKEQIIYRNQAVEDFYNNTLIRQSVSDLLKEVKDIGRISGKISNGNLLPIDCLALCRSLEILPELKLKLSGFSSKYINDVINRLCDFTSIVKLLKSSIYDESEQNITEDEKKKQKNKTIIKEGYNKELDEYRYLCKNGKSAIAELEKREKERTGIKSLRICYNRVFGYNIEVTKSFLDKIPYDYVRRQTLANAERFITDELKELENKLLSAEDSAEILEQDLFLEIKKVLSSKIVDMQKTSDAIAELDVLISFATVARENGYVKPEITGFGQEMKIVDGRHPVVEAVSKQRFIPNSVYMDSDQNRTLIITGPNMAGKSTYMRQIAIISIMAQIGSYVPAKSAILPLIDKIFTRIGASDNLIFDQSTFMVEMTETADIIKRATKNSLVILDEIGRGTSTYDGLSIAWSVLDYFTLNVKAKILFATHYHELTKLEGVLDGVKNYRVSVKELAGNIVFTRKIERGAANKSFGIEVAELAGIDKRVIDNAKEILKNLEKGEHKKESGNLSIKNDKKDSEIESIIRDLDVNNITPIQSFNILNDLYERLKSKDE